MTQDYEEHATHGEVVRVSESVAATNRTPRATASHTGDDVVSCAALDGKRIACLAEKRVTVEGNLRGVDLEMPQSLGAAEYREIVPRSVELQPPTRGAQRDDDVGVQRLPRQLGDVRLDRPGMHETIFGPHHQRSVLRRRRAVTVVTSAPRSQWEARA